MKTFAQRLRRRAEELQLSHAEIARRIGLSERRFGHYVSGTREPDLATLVKISGTLGTSPNVLLGLDDIPGKSGENADLRSAICIGLTLLNSANLRSVRALVDAMLEQQRKSKGAAR